MTQADRASEAVIFLHVPKAAGSTLNRLIEWEYPLFEMYSIDPVLFRFSWGHLQRLSKKRLRRTRIFKGHMLFGLHAILPQPATYITVLREPVDRVISAFYFMRTYKLHPLYWKFKFENWSLEDFVRRSPRENVQCKIIAGAEYEKPCTAEICERAKENLVRYFSVVGLFERFEESLALMKLRFGWKLQRYSSFNVTRTRPKKAVRCFAERAESSPPVRWHAQQSYFSLPLTHTQPKSDRLRVNWNRRERELRPHLARRYFRSVRLDGRLSTGPIPVSRSKVFWR